MYRGFNLAWGIDRKQQIAYLDKYIKRFGIDFDDEYIREEIKKLNKFQQIYVSKENSEEILLDGDKIEQDCFPEVRANVFLSHSHDDEPVAFRIKFVLEKIYRQNVFIDSCAWSYCNDLLYEIDDQYCKGNNGLFDYNKRNNSTAIVHMMLSTALTRMMDKTECIFFLNTGNSNLGDAYGNDVQTASPWIYHELSMTHVLRKRIDRDIRGGVQERAVPLDESFSAMHSVDIHHFPVVDMDSFFKWLSGTCGYSDPSDVMDALYRHYPES